MFFKKNLKKNFQLKDYLSIITTNQDKNILFKPIVYFNLNKTFLKNNQIFNLQLIESNLTNNLKNLVSSIKIDKQNDYYAYFYLNRENFILNVINSFKNGINNYNDFFGYEFEKKNFLVEFSSPNIAKKLHYGNFRSTIIGNFLSNLFKYKGHSVKKINYIGDWGTQFGILLLAYDQFGDDKELENNTSNHLLDIYVKGNRLAELDENFLQKAKIKFDNLENQTDKKVFDQWKKIRNLSLKEFNNQYAKLNIHFDLMQFESDFNKKSKQFFQNLKLDNLKSNKDGSKIYKFDDKKLDDTVLLKKNGTTLYITRDIIAAIERKNMFNFDKCFYVVDSSQSKHFKKLKIILKNLGFDWHDQLIYLPFGRVHGLSTRKGSAKLIDDVLIVSEKLSKESSLKNLNTKLSEEEIENNKLYLSLACLIVKDFQKPIIQEYKFDFDSIVSQKGKTGISLQYTYSRLYNLRLNCGHNLNLNCDLDLDSIRGNESLILLSLICKFDEIIEISLKFNCPSYLVTYLFDLSKAINKAYKVYQIKNQSKLCGETRILLFYCAELVFKQCMELIGIKALKKI